jgi:hypothetical protein
MIHRRAMIKVEMSKSTHKETLQDKQKSIKGDLLLIRQYCNDDTNQRSLDPTSV